MTTITSGVLFGGGVILSPPPAPPIIASGLILNLQTAPASGTTWINQVSGTNTTIVGPTDSANVTYVAQYGGGIRILTKNRNFFDTGYTAASFGNTFTMSMTVAFDQTTSYWATWWGMEKYNASATGYFAYQNGSTSLAVGSGSSATSITFSSFGANIAQVNVWDFTVSGRTVNYYLNGVWKGVFGLSAEPAGGAGTENLYFASRHNNAGGSGVNDSAPGTYYSMRAYNRVLSNVEVASNYTSLKAIHGLP